MEVRKDEAEMNINRGNEDRRYSIFYKFIMPIISILLLLLVSSLLGRKLLLNNFFIDVVARVFITCWFVGLFIRLSKLDKYSIYSNKQWSKKEVRKSEKLLILLGVAIFSLGCTILTWWSFKIFVPIDPLLIYVFAGINGIIIFIPLAKRFWVLKI